jgi:hypothetical protein
MLPFALMKPGNSACREVMRGRSAQLRRGSIASRVNTSHGGGSLAVTGTVPTSARTAKRTWAGKSGQAFTIRARSGSKASEVVQAQTRRRSVSPEVVSALGLGLVGSGFISRVSRVRSPPHYLFRFRPIIPLKIRYVSCSASEGKDLFVMTRFIGPIDNCATNVTGRHTSLKRKRRRPQILRLRFRLVWRWMRSCQ